MSAGAAMAAVHPRFDGVTSPLARFLGLKLVRATDGEAEVHAPVRGDYMNAANTVHGGLLATLLDNAVSFAVLTTPQGLERRGVMTLSLTVNFVGASAAVDHLIGRARTVGGGRGTAFCEGEVVEPGGRRVATATALMKYR